MQEYHFFPDTNFFIDHPYFHRRFLFDDRPCTIVICNPVIRELDELKKSPDDPPSSYGGGSYLEKEAHRAFQARRAVRSIRTALDDETSLPAHIQVVRYRKKIKERTISQDEAILQLAEQYAQENENASVVLLTGDINLRNFAHGSAVQAVDPDHWQQERLSARLLHLARALGETDILELHDQYVSLKQQLSQPEIRSNIQLARQIQHQIKETGKLEYVYLRTLESRLQRGPQELHDKAIREAYERRLQLQEELQQVETSGPSKELECIYEQFRQAFEKERAEVERYIAERVAAQQRLRAEQQEAQLRLQAEQREAQRNKYQVELLDIVQSPGGELTYPIETPDFETVGQVLVSRYWWYIEQQRDDLVCTLHVHARVDEELAPELLVVSASDKLEYSPPSPYKLISPSNQGLAQITAGNWKVIVRAEELETSWQPLLRTPQYRHGTSPAFASLRLSIMASEMNPEEVQAAEQARHLGEEQPKVTIEEKLPIPKESQRTPWWPLAVVIPIAFLALALLTPAFLCILSIMLNVLIGLLSR